MLERDSKLPLDLMVGEPRYGPSPTMVTTAGIDEYKENLIHNLRCAYKIVHEHSEIEKFSQKLKYDQRTFYREFKIGDLVWVANTAPQIGETCVTNIPLFYPHLFLNHPVFHIIRLLVNCISNGALKVLTFMCIILSLKFICFPP